jgi:GMP synthase-like glutamine amidotransferase
MKIIKIALLIADRPADVVVEQYGDYNKMFKDLLSAGCLSLRNRQQADLEVEWTSFDLHKLQIPTNPQQFDAMLITGSSMIVLHIINYLIIPAECSAYDSDEWIQRLKQFIRQTATDAPKVKWIGICFGHQVICEALGGKVTPNPKGKYHLNVNTLHRYTYLDNYGRLGSWLDRDSVDSGSGY